MIGPGRWLVTESIQHVLTEMLTKYKPMFSPNVDEYFVN